ncbi:M28 family metallopeptidase [Alienimonas californiensis]|uniref:M28 family metallopeptidase n=1 Tax=Alienimonas californiensis TaxID=2527989 RepID=UPI0013FD098D|nr:M28 family peptidase [Alienimonas californiensis]
MIAASVWVFALPSAAALGQDAPAETPPPVVAAEQITPQRITADDLRPHVEFLADPARGGRPGGRADAAAEYLAAHFQSLGLEPVFEASPAAAPGNAPADGDGGAGGKSFFQTIAGPDGGPFGRNVAALLPGSDPAAKAEVVMIGAHYDHLGVRGGVLYPGADDNASGTAMLMEAAERLADDAKQGDGPRRSVLFVAFDLEERMLFGSRWFAAHPPAVLTGGQDDATMRQLKAVFVADMIGRSLGDLDLPTVFVMGSEHAPHLKSVLDRVGTPEGLEAARLGIDLIGTRSDYGPFRDRDIPFLFFSTGEHKDYHRPTDTPENLNVEKAARVASLILAITVTTANDAEAPVWEANPSPDLDEARAVNRITGLLLERAASPENPTGRRFGTMQKVTLAQTKSVTEGVLERGVMTEKERSWLVRLSQVLLLSVF